MLDILLLDCHFFCTHVSLECAHDLCYDHRMCLSCFVTQSFRGAVGYFILFWGLASCIVGFGELVKNGKD